MYIRLKGRAYKVFKEDNNYYVMKRKNYKKKVNRNHVYYGSPSTKSRGTPIKTNLSRLLKQDKKLRGKIKELKSMVKYCNTSVNLMSNDDCQTTLKLKILEEQKALKKLREAEIKLQFTEEQNGKLIQAIKDIETSGGTLLNMSKEVNNSIEASATKMKEERESVAKSIEDLQKQLVSLQSRNLELQTQCTSEKEQLQQTCDLQKKELETQNTELLQQIENFKNEKKELGEIKSELEELQNSKSATEREKEDAITKLKELEEINTDYDTKLEKLKSQLQKNEENYNSVLLKLQADFEQ